MMNGIEVQVINRNGGGQLLKSVAVKVRCMLG